MPKGKSCFSVEILQLRRLFPLMFLYNRKFLSTTYRRRAQDSIGSDGIRCGMVLGIFGLSLNRVYACRSKLSQASVDKALLSSPPNKSEIAVELSSRHRISEILGEPVLISPQIEAVTDELAELVVTNSSFDASRMEDSQSALVSLKPIASGSLIS
jgi:hypothetical protein